MRRGYLIFAAVVFAVAVVVCWQSVTLVIWTPIGPGPGFFTVILGGVMGLLAVGVAWEHRKVPAAGPATVPAGEETTTEAPPAARAPEEPRGLAALVGALRRPSKAMLIGAALVVLPFVLEPLGYRITVVALLLYVLGFVERRRLWVSLLVAVGGSLITYYLFSDLLGVPLPRGLLGV